MPTFLPALVILSAAAFAILVILYRIYESRVELPAAKFKYAAYLSYSHKDEIIAASLHREMERYRLPPESFNRLLVEDVRGRRIGKIFRDREELAAGSPLTDTLHRALADSAALVVLCSPNSAQSAYVNLEIAYFRTLDKADRIIPVIIDGDPPTCFPTELSELGELLGADLRPNKDGRNAGLTKIMAGLAGLGHDDFIHRNERDRSRWWSIALAIVVIVIGIIVAAIWMGLAAHFHDQERQQEMLNLQKEVKCWRQGAKNCQPTA